MAGEMPSKNFFFFFFANDMSNAGLSVWIGASLWHGAVSQCRVALVGDLITPLRSCLVVRLSICLLVDSLGPNGSFMLAAECDASPLRVTMFTNKCNKLLRNISKLVNFRQWFEVRWV